MDPTTKMSGPGGLIPIALDAMGGDHGPRETVAGAVLAVKQSPVAIALVGEPDLIHPEIERLGASNLPLQVVRSSGVVAEDESPVTAFRSKPNASVFVAAGAVKAGKAAAFVSMGSTGASIAAATVVFGTMEGVDRGALGGPIVGYAPNTVIIDLGTNVDTRPQQLLDFAALGSVISRLIYGADNPRVAILSVGSEAGKGNRQVRETSELLNASSLNFIGNLEPGDLTGGNAEVVICDGFVGNMVLKLTEALGQAIVTDIEAAVGQTDSGAALARDVFDRTNVLEALGGGPLLGVNGVAIVGHGRALAPSIANAIATAVTIVTTDFVKASADELSKIRTEVLN